MFIIAWLRAAIDRWNSRRNLSCGLLCQQKKRKKTETVNSLIFPRHYLSLEINVVIISDK